MTSLRERFGTDWWVRCLPRSAAGKGVASLAAASAVAQTLTAVSSPLLTRIYSAEDFGTAAVFTSILSFGAVIASLRYELAIPLPKDELEARRVVALCFLVLVFTSGGLGVLVGVAGPSIARALRTPALSRYSWLLPLGLLTLGAYQTLSYYGLRRQAYSIVARTRLTQSIAGVLATIAIGLVAAGPVGQLVGAVIARGAGVGALARQLGRHRQGSNGGGHTSLSVGLSEIKSLALRYSKFPRFAVAAGLLNTAALAVTPLLLSTLYGPQSAGNYSLALRVVGLPMAVIGQAVRQVFLGEASHVVRNMERRLWNLMRRGTLRLLPWAVAVLGLGACCPFFFPPLFGTEWKEAGLFAAVLAIFGAAQLITSPISAVVFVLERQGVQLVLDALRTALVVAAFVGGRFAGASPLEALGVFTVAMCTVYGLSFVLYRRMATTWDRQQGA